MKQQCTSSVSDVQILAKFISKNINTFRIEHSLLASDIHRIISQFVNKPHNISHHKTNGFSCEFLYFHTNIN